ncbi:Spastin [Carex littledalei]|uniref:Spastin n=1 Tax=Carex littledalei TaxID=544730 RepID=A0A833VJH8_9POAL|nr:Spastin [Carex littledalei]
MDDSRNAPAAAKSEKKTASTVPENKGGEPGKSDTAVKKDASISKDVAPDNEFEKRIRPEVIPANEIGVTFDDIGALDDIKESLQELVMLPLRRPDLFKGGLLKPCRGILLFGPPEKADDGLDFKELATITEGYSGSDLKNLCTTAAYRPVRELIQRERLKELEYAGGGRGAAAPCERCLRLRSTALSSSAKIIFEKSIAYEFLYPTA